MRARGHRTRPRRSGWFVVVVGPDGVGKTTVSDAILAAAEEPRGYFHFRPPVNAGLPSRVPPQSDPTPKNVTQPKRFVGWLRLAAALVRFWVGYLTSVRPILNAGGLVVGDRWAYGYLVQPKSLRFAGPAFMARWLIRLLPQPDLVVNLAAPADVIRSRKPELSSTEIRSELITWPSLPVQRLVTLNAQRDPAELAKRVWSGLKA